MNSRTNVVLWQNGKITCFFKFSRQFLKIVVPLTVWSKECVILWSLLNGGSAAIRLKAHRSTRLHILNPSDQGRKKSVWVLYYVHSPFEKHATVLQKFQSSVVIFQFQSKWKSFHHSKHGLNSKKGMGSWGIFSKSYKHQPKKLTFSHPKYQTE